MGTLVTPVAGVFPFHLLARFYADLSVAPGWHLGLLFGIGGVIGMYFGARTQKYVPARLIKGMLCICVLFVAGKYILAFIL